MVGRTIVGRPSIYFSATDECQDMTMYEMYPDAWTVVEDRQQQATGDRPRRRARKEHSVVPAVISRHTEAVRPTQAA
jgi:hypothetical protein